MRHFWHQPLWPWLCASVHYIDSYWGVIHYVCLAYNGLYLELDIGRSIEFIIPLLTTNWIINQVSIYLGYCIRAITHASTCLENELPLWQMLPLWVTDFIIWANHWTLFLTSYKSMALIGYSQLPYYQKQSRDKIKFMSTCQMTSCINEAPILHWPSYLLKEINWPRVI